MKKILFLALGVVLLGTASCSNSLKGKFGKILSGSSEEAVEVEEVEEAEAVPEFEITNNTLEQTVDCDGLNCVFTFDIDWPSDGPKKVVDKVRRWIAASVIGREVSFNSALELEEAVISNDRYEGNIGKTVKVEISVGDSEIEVTTTVSWVAGYSVSSPWGETTRTATFNISNGQIISEDVERDGDDLY